MDGTNLLTKYVEEVNIQILTVNEFLLVYLNFTDYQTIGHWPMI